MIILHKHTISFLHSKLKHLLVHDFFHLLSADDSVCLSVNVHLDSIKLCPLLFKNGIFEDLESVGFKLIERRRTQRGQYPHSQKFGRAAERIQVLYGNVESAGQITYHFCRIKLKNPSPELISLLTALYPVTPLKLSSVEIAFDFSSDCVGSLPWFKAVLEDTVYLKHRSNSQKAFYYDSVRKTLDTLGEDFCDRYHRSYTFYSSDTRTGAKALKVYKREKQDFVRLELTLHRHILRKKNFDILDSLKQIGALDLSQFFCFKVLDQEKLEKYWVKKTQQINGLKGSVGKGILWKMHEDVVAGSGQDFLSYLARLYPSVMKQTEILKEYGVRWHRFLVDL